VNTLSLHFPICELGCLVSIHRVAERIMVVGESWGICHCAWHAGCLAKAWQQVLGLWEGGRSPGRNAEFFLCLQVQPIHEMLLHTNLGPLETKRQNLHRALDQYLMEFNACRCGPCLNNGEPILEGTSCRCQCRLGHQGPACEQIQLEGKAHASYPAPPDPA
jgi:hypothetical protein